MNSDEIYILKKYIFLACSEVMLHAPRGSSNINGTPWSKAAILAAIYIKYNK